MDDGIEQWKNWTVSAWGSTEKIYIKRGVARLFRSRNRLSCDGINSSLFINKHVQLLSLAL
jgi:hypothetical protein